MRILVPTDFSDNAKVALNYVLALFGEVAEEIVLLNTWQVPHTGVGMLVSIEDILKEESEKAMADLVHELKNEVSGSFKLKGLVKGGSLADVVRSIQRTETYDLLVMGTKGADDVRKKMLGSNTANVVRISRTPVLVVPNDVDIHSPSKVALATDFSDLSASQVEFIKYVVNAFESDFVAVHVDKNDEEMEKAPSDQWEARFNGSAPKVVTVQGEDVAESIDQYVSEQDVDLIGVVRQEHGFFEGLFRKSVSRAMAMYSKVPLLVIPEAS